jgi:type II secretory pathway component HofQ
MIKFGAALLAALNAWLNPPAPIVEIATPTPIESKICSIDVAEYDLGKTLQIISKQTGANLVLLSDPGTKVTLRLNDVPVGVVIRHLSGLTGLQFLKVDETYVFARPEQLLAAYPAEYALAFPAPAAKPAPQKSTQVYRTNYVNADSLVGILTAMFPADLLQAVTGPEVATPFLNSVNTGEVTGVQNNGSAQANTQEARDQYGENVKRDLLNKSRQLVLSGDAETVEKALALARQLDIPRKQVVIDVSVLETSDDLAKELGLSWSFSNFTISEKANASGMRPLSLGDGQRSPLDAKATITAKDLWTKSTILASPNVSVLDGESAYVLIGSRIKYSVLANAATPTSPAVFDVREERVGVYLQVAAQVANDGTITLNLYPQVSTITGYLNVNGSSLPQIATREARTILRLKTGDTVVMGGLIQDQDIRTLESVPFLSDIPVLGEFFKRRKTSKVKTHLILSITPRVVEVQP